MSTQMAFFRFSRFAAATPPMVPPTGPDNSVWSGCERANEALTTPPDDCITCTGTPRPRPLNRSSMWPR